MAETATKDKLVTLEDLKAGLDGGISIDYADIENVPRGFPALEYLGMIDIKSSMSNMTLSANNAYKGITSINKFLDPRGYLANKIGPFQKSGSNLDLTNDDLSHTIILVQPYGCLETDYSDHINNVYHFDIAPFFGDTSTTSYGYVNDDYEYNNMLISLSSNGRIARGPITMLGAFAFIESETHPNNHISPYIEITNLNNESMVFSNTTSGAFSNFSYIGFRMFVFSSQYTYPYE